MIDWPLALALFCMYLLGGLSVLILLVLLEPKNEKDQAQG